MGCWVGGYWLCVVGGQEVQPPSHPPVAGQAREEGGRVALTGEPAPCTHLEAMTDVLEVFSVWEQPVFPYSSFHVLLVTDLECVVGEERRVRGPKADAGVASPALWMLALALVGRGAVGRGEGGGGRVLEG